MGEWQLIRPEATTNLIDNPSFETGTSGWGAGGSNTIAQSAEQQHFGVYSVKCTYQDSVTFVSQTSTATYADATHYVTVRIYVPSSYDGGNLRILILSNTDGTETQVAEWEPGTSPTDEWFLLETSFVPDTDFTWSVGVVGNGAPSVGEFIYVDGWQVEEKSYYTTYCDGDQEDCEWDGAEHASTSTRVAYGIGGRVLDMDSDLDFKFEVMQGIGAPPTNLHFDGQPQLNRDTLKSLRYDRRMMQFKSTIIGTSLSDLHDKRQTILQALDPLTGKASDAPRLRRLRYTGASVDKETDASYDDGLGFSKQEGFTEEAQVRFIAPDPNFYQVGESGAELSTTDTITVRNVAALIDGQWDDLGPPNSSGTYDGGIALVADKENGYVYIGGDFRNFDNIANADSIVRYDVAAGTYAALGTGASGANEGVYDMAVAPNGDLYAVGAFTGMGGVSGADNIARWDGSSWNALSSGLDNTARSVAITAGGRIYVGGDFADDGAAAVTMNKVGYWDGSSWNAIGSGPGLDDNVFEVAIIPASATAEHVYVGGNFRAENGGTPGDLERFVTITTPDGTPAFLTPSAGFNNTVRAIVRVAKGTVWFGGTFTEDSDGNTLNHIGEWTGTGQATEVAGGISGLTVGAITPVSDGSVWVGFWGTADIGGLTNVNHIAKVVGGEWQLTGLSLPSSGSFVQDIIEYGEDVYIATEQDGTGTTSIAGSTNITYEGTAPAYPVIKIKRSGGTSATLHEIRNVTTGAVLSFDTYDIQDGETVIIDTRPGHRSVHNNKGENLLRHVQGVSDFGAFYLAPGNDGNRTNTIDILTVEGGSPTMTSTVRFRTAYRSAD